MDARPVKRPSRRYHSDERIRTGLFLPTYLPIQDKAMKYKRADEAFPVSSGFCINSFAKSCAVL